MSDECERDAMDADELPVKWIGADGASHEISIRYAAQLVKLMFDTHGDVLRVDALVAAVNSRDALVKALRETAAVLKTTAFLHVASEGAKSIILDQVKDAAAALSLAGQQGQKT